MPYILTVLDGRVDVLYHVRLDRGSVGYVY